ncbi:MAG: DUF805 domain-containing protein [Alphaproteobacteria bacterium]|nr:DUF805 domain-containing protein [Alphaproteobacteria bacterium]
MDWQNLLFATQGRIGAGDYWRGVAVIIVGNLLINVLPLIGGLVWLVLVWVGVAVYGKRLHDTGRSAWFHLIPWLLNMVVFAIGLMLIGGVVLAAALSDGEIGPMVIFGAGGAGVAVIGFTNLIWLIYTLWLGAMTGDSGENRFGPAPAINVSAQAADDS